jgi:hypothetical protein
MKSKLPIALVSFLVSSTRAGENWGPGVHWGQLGLPPPPGVPGPPKPPVWADWQWNWGHGSPRGGPPNHNTCPPGLTGPPRWQLPFQAMMPLHYAGADWNQHWEHMCPRDQHAGVLYHPVPDNRGCCTWQATATLANGKWACCQCGATCTGAVPGMGAQWTQGQRWPAVATVTGELQSHWTLQPIV